MIPVTNRGAFRMPTLNPPMIRVTPDELLLMPDNGSMELVDGQIVKKPVSMDSSGVENFVAFRLTAHDPTGRVSRVFPASLGYQCFQNVVDDPDRMRKPDCTVVLSSRINALPVADPGFMPIVPDLAVEVVSKNDVYEDVIRKVREYREAGFPLVWVVDPLDRTVTVYPNPGKPFILTEEDEIRAESALPGFVCRVSELFPVHESSAGS
jgi:Uma2 family endonuclease